MSRARFLLPTLLLALPAAPRPTQGVPAAAADVEPYRGTVATIIAEAVARGRAHAMLRDLCGTAPHRLSGSPGAARAVEWAQETMEAIGLENVRVEPCTVPHWTRGAVERLSIVEPRELAGQTLRILALGGSVGTPEAGITAPLVEVRSLAELEERDAARRFVFFNRPMDAELLDTFTAYGLAVDQRRDGASRAAKAGGVGAIVRSMTTRIDDAPHTGAMVYDPRVERKVPAVAISTLGAERLSGLLVGGKDVVLRLELDCRTLDDAPSFNVVGEIVGREHPEEIVLVGGHLDCWDVGQGAHDDGSGCCQSLEVARLLLRLGLRPRRTIRVVLFMNEENGLRGGRAYHADHRDELADHVLALESDRGGFTPRGFTSDADPGALETLRAIVGLMAQTGADRVIPGFGGADVSPLSRGGVVTMGYLPDPQRYFDVHHSANDTIDAVNPRELNLGAGVMAAMCYVVAELPDRLPRNQTSDR